MIDPLAAQWWDPEIPAHRRGQLFRVAGRSWRKCSGCGAWIGQVPGPYRPKTSCDGTCRQRALKRRQRAEWRAAWGVQEAPKRGSLESALSKVFFPGGTWGYSFHPKPEWSRGILLTQGYPWRAGYDGMIQQKVTGRKVRIYFAPLFPSWLSEQNRRLGIPAGGRGGRFWKNLRPAGKRRIQPCAADPVPTTGGSCKPLQPFDWTAAGSTGGSPDCSGGLAPDERPPGDAWFPDVCGKLKPGPRWMQWRECQDAAA